MGDIFDQAAQPTQASGDVFDQAASGASGVDNRSLLDRAANDPNNIPLDSYAHATERGLANIGQGVIQAGQGLYNVVAHSDKASQSIVDAAKNLVTNPVQTVKNALPKDLLEAGDMAGRGAGQAIAAVAGNELGAAAKRLPVTGPKAIATVKDLKNVPAALSADTSSTLATVAHNEGLPPLTSTTAREATDELSQSFINRAKQQYGVVDKAVGGDLKPVQERIQNLKQAIRAQANVNPDLADKYIEDLAQQQKTLAGLVDKAKAAGVSNAEDLMAAGDKDYARGMAMKNVSKGVKTASGVAKSGGHPNPVLFANQVDRLYNSGTLARALGEDGAQAMLDTAKKGLSKARTASTVKKVALGAAIGGAGTAGAVAAKSVLSGQ